MGENRWRDEMHWPPDRTGFVTFYLHSGGTANSAGGDGTLSTVAPASEQPDRYRYDPEHPVPTAGGRFVGGGVQDQLPNQARQDVLVYTAEAVQSPLEITGPVEVSLCAATDGPDTDFVAVLSDVHPDGFVQNLVEGVVRGRFRDAFDDPRPMEPGAVYRLHIPLGNISHVVGSGHRLRLHVTSSNFPRWDRNPNTGQPLGSATSTRVAQQTVFHDEKRSSRLVLPIVHG
jgi:hypothetical protein